MDTKDLAQKLVDSFLNALPQALDEARPPLLEIEANRQWVEVDEGTWRSWTGRRMVNGAEHHGPVFLLGAPEGAPPYTGARSCSCKACQEHVEPRFKPN
ncbi:MAG: hypothetical protein EBT03_11180 [Betaproteobacteria bacterium]|nr:hypothetical protein [Betaproteobacteria bacterium]NCA17881.1 hypothetical protein [Betaproteobacteria bacterium]